MKHLLTVAGSDSSGGAGIQADLKTFAAHGAYGMSVITSVTAQNTFGVSAVYNMDPEMVQKQLEAVFEDIRVDAVKIGMLSAPEIICAVADAIERYKPPFVVLDPVMVSKSGFSLLQENARETLKSKLFPLSTVVTPNIPEAEVIAGVKINDARDMEICAKTIFAMMPESVLIKGGHWPDRADDLLFDGQEFYWFGGAHINSSDTHGTGCTLSSAIAANLAENGDIISAVQKAKTYVTVAIQHGLKIGHGAGPTHHFVNFFQKAGFEV